MGRIWDVIVRNLVIGTLRRVLPKVECRRLRAHGAHRLPPPSTEPRHVPRERRVSWEVPDFHREPERRRPQSTEAGTRPSGGHSPRQQGRGTRREPHGLRRGRTGAQNAQTGATSGPRKRQSAALAPEPWPDTWTLVSMDTRTPSTRPTLVSN